MIENQPEFHSLNAPGIAVLVKGESYRPKPLFAEKLASKVRPLEPDHFARLPISNICFQQNEQGGYDNASAFLEIDGFDESVLAFLQNPQATTVSILEVNEAVAVFSGCDHLVQVGFNVGGGEIVFKRILLPGNYQPPADQPIEPLVYLGSKMPNVFVEAWDKLKVGDWDRDWDERVREQLAGNSRDMDKRIVYQMINGEKWVEWNGVKMWAGLLSDRRDIGRFLAEESALATLKPGEFMVAKYSHGGGGAISAATAQQRKMDKPQIVGDVQMMGENGIIYQAAVEGEIDQIDALINGLVGQLHRDQNLSLPETITSVKPWLAGLPILPLATYPAKFLLRNEIPIGLKPEALPLTVDAGVTESVVSVTPPIFDLTPDIYSWAANDVEFIDFEFGFEAGAVDDAIDWWEPDSGPDWDGGDDSPVWPQEPVPGGGGGAKLPTVTSRSNLEVTSIDVALAAVPTKTVFVAQDTPVYIVAAKSNDQPTRTVLVGNRQEPDVAVKTSGRVPEGEKPVGSRLHPGIRGASSATVTILPPVWQPDILPFNEKEVSPLDLTQWIGGSQEYFTIFIIARHYAILYTILVHLSDGRGSGGPRQRVVIYTS